MVSMVTMAPMTTDAVRVPRARMSGLQCRSSGSMDTADMVR